MSLRCLSISVPASTTGPPAQPLACRTAQVPSGPPISNSPIGLLRAQYTHQTDAGPEEYCLSPELEESEQPTFRFETRFYF